MSVEAYSNVTNYPFILSGESVVKEAETLAQDAGRGSVDLERHTLMAYNPTTKKWEPFTNEAATDGTAYPRGIILAKVEAAAIVAGDVDDLPILVGRAVIDSNQLVIENSKTLETIINVPAGVNVSVEDYLRLLSIFAADTVSIEEFENAP